VRIGGFEFTVEAPAVGTRVPLFPSARISRFFAAIFPCQLSMSLFRHFFPGARVSPLALVTTDTTAAGETERRNSAWNCVNAGVVRSLASHGGEITPIGGARYLVSTRIFPKLVRD
jgi:hypothetical protein